MAKEEKEVKYVVNTKNMAFEFVGGRILERKGIIQVDEKELAELETDDLFVDLKNRKVITVSKVKPSEFQSSGEVIADAHARIAELEKENAELKAEVEKYKALCKTEEEGLDTEAPKTTTKKGNK